MASKCKKKWKSTLRPNTGGSIVETISIITDNSGVLKGAHHESGKGVDGSCLVTGMNLSRPDDGAFPRYLYSGDFVDGDEDKVKGTYIVINHVDSKLDAESGGDWEAEKTT
jgi:hypothetical protein